MIAETRDGKQFVSDVYDGSPAARAGILVGDELLDVDAAPYREIASFAGKFAHKVAIRLGRLRTPADQRRRSGPAHGTAV